MQFEAITFGVAISTTIGVLLLNTSPPVGVALISLCNSLNVVWQVIYQIAQTARVYHEDGRNVIATNFQLTVQKQRIKLLHATHFVKIGGDRSISSSLYQYRISGYVMLIKNRIMPCTFVLFWINPVSLAFISKPVYVRCNLKDFGSTWRVYA